MRLLPTKQESTRQKVSITLKTFRGEWLFNINAGVPYLANDNNDVQLLDKGQKSLLDLEIKQAILSTEGVVSLQSFTSVFSDSERAVDVSFSAVTEEGGLIALTTTI